MSFQEKRAYVTLFSSVLIFGGYCLYVFQNYREQIVNSPNDFGFWGAAFLILIPVSIVANIIIQIVFAIVNKMVTGEDMPKVTDELDKLIELKAIRGSHWTFIIGFFLAMGTQVLDMQPYVMLITIVSAGFIASVVAEATKIYLYRKGV